MSQTGSLVGGGLGAGAGFLIGGPAGAKLGMSLGSMAGGMFGNKKKKYNPQISPFSFTPDANDPEIAMRRNAALLDIGRAHAGTVNEIGRAGLLGSSAAFGLLNQDQTQGDAMLEGIPNSVYAKQRQDALTLYRDDANFQRSMALNEQGYGQQEHMAGLDALGSIGENLPYLFGNSSNPYDSIAAQKRRALLAGGSPRSSLDTTRY